MTGGAPKAILSLAGVALLAACILLCLRVSSADPRAAAGLPVLPVWGVLAGWILLALALLVLGTRALRAWIRSRRPIVEERIEKPVALWPVAVAMLAGLTLTVFLASLVLSFVRPPEPEEGSQPELGKGEAAEEKADEEPLEIEEEAHEEVEPADLAAAALGVAATVTAVLLALLVIRMVRRSREAGPEVEEARKNLRRELAAGLRVSLEEILAEQDYRRAVVACYRRMEQSFGLAGYPRKPSEAPFEYLERVVGESGAVIGVYGTGRVGGSLGALTRLYEVARFSEHPIHSGERAEAIESLRALEGAIASSSTEGLS